MHVNRPLLFERHSHAKPHPVNRDTPPRSRDRYHELLAAQKPYERLAQSVRLTRMVRELAVEGMRARHPEAGEEELRVRLAVRLYGRAIAERLFGEVPADAL